MHPRNGAAITTLISLHSVGPSLYAVERPCCFSGRLHRTQRRADVIFCLRNLACNFVRASTSRIEELYAFSEECRIPKVATFGKFSGMPVRCRNRLEKLVSAADDKDPYCSERSELTPDPACTKE